MRICRECLELFREGEFCPTDGLPLETVLDPLIGTIVGGRYRLVAEIGRGATARVYLARHTVIDRLVAIKLLQIMPDDEDGPASRTRLLREARAVNRIKHPNIVEVLDVGETDDGYVYLVMEYLPGRPLREAIEAGPIGVERTILIAHQIGSALARAHQANVVHRDLKPENIVLVERGDKRDFVKLLDFGVAKLLDASELTSRGFVLGTRGYIAPETVMDESIDGRADLYTLGVLIYEMLTGELPFDYANLNELLLKHLRARPTPPSALKPGLPKELDALVMRCLEVDREARFQDAYHFLDALEACASSSGAPLRPRRRTGQMPRYLVDDPTAPLEAVPTRQSARTARRSVEVATTEGSSTLAIDVVVEEVEELDADQLPVMLVVRTGRDHGPLAVNRWRARYDAIHASLHALARKGKAPAEVVGEVRQAGHRLGDLERGVEGLVSLNGRIEEIHSAAIDFREMLGRGADETAEELSFWRRELEHLRRIHTELEGRKALVQHRGGGADGTRRAGSLLQHLAQADRDLVDAEARCEKLETRLQNIREDLETQNEATERELRDLNARIEQLLSRLEPLAESLREPLHRAEQVIRQAQSERVPAPRPTDG